MGCGIASGENRAVEEAQKEISSPLLEGVKIKWAKSVLLNVHGSSNLSMQEIYAGNNVIFEAAGEEANVIFGCVKKDEMNDYVSYTVIATGFQGSNSSGKSKTTALPKSTSATSVDSFRGGFNFKDPEEINQDDLEIPTFFRLNGAQSKM